jgi:hypothetical protein
MTFFIHCVSLLIEINGLKGEYLQCFNHDILIKYFKLKITFLMNLRRP